MEPLRFKGKIILFYNLYKKIVIKYLRNIDNITVIYNVEFISFMTGKFGSNVV